MKAYKGFNKDMTCRGFQYEEGETYETDTAELCKSGFHACEAPLDVWRYYPPVDDNADINRFCEVEMADVSPQISDDSKRVSKKLTIGAEIGIPGLVKAHIEWVKEQMKECEDIAKNVNRDAAKIGSSWRYAKIGSSGYAAKIGSSGYAAKIGSSGDAAQIGSSGDDAKIGSSGYAAQIGSSGYAAQIGSSGRYAKIGSSGRYAKIGSSGDDAQIGSSGYAAQIGSSGYAAKIGSSGDDAQIGSSGYAAQIGSSGYAAQIGSSGRYAKIGSSGRYAKIGSSGDDAKIEVKGGHAVVSCAGKRAMVKGPVGTWITLAEYGEFDGEGYPCICVRSVQIDGETIKADTWYTLRDGEFQEVLGNA